MINIYKYVERNEENKTSQQRNGRHKGELNRSSRVRRIIENSSLKVYWMSSIAEWR
jgi:hypothetical protein